MEANSLADIIAWPGDKSELSREIGRFIYEILAARVRPAEDLPEEGRHRLRARRHHDRRLRLREAVHGPGSCMSR